MQIKKQLMSRALFNGENCCLLHGSHHDLFLLQIHMSFPKVQYDIAAIPTEPETILTLLLLILTSFFHAFCSIHYKLVILKVFQQQFVIFLISLALTF